LRKRTQGKVKKKHQFTKEEDVFPISVKRKSTWKKDLRLVKKREGTAKKGGKGKNSSGERVLNPEDRSPVSTVKRGGKGL